MERPRPAIGPTEFRRQSKMIGLIGLVMDVLVAVVLFAFQVFEQTILLILIAALLGTGVFVAFLFVVIFPRNYQRNYETRYGPEL